jgi:hypothetical protein
MGQEQALVSMEVWTMGICRTVCVWWELWAWHPPVGVWIGILGFLGVLVALIRDLSKIGRREKAAWVFVMFALLMLEIKSVYQDRNEHDQQQEEAREKEERSFRVIADGITGAMERSDQNFQATMQQSGLLKSDIATLRNLQKKALDRLKPVGGLLTQQLVMMKPKDLIDTTHAVATQMQVFQQKYLYADTDIDNGYFSAATRGGISDKESQSIVKEEDQKRAELRLAYEREAKELIAKANALRAEIINRLSLSERSQEDEKRRAWFEHPETAKSTPTISLLFHLQDNANYLNSLAARLAGSGLID